MRSLNLRGRETRMTTTNRRTILKGVTALAVVPAAAASAQAGGATPIARLWSLVEACDKALQPHHAAMIEAETLRGVTGGWMYLTGDAHSAGQRRYDALVAILNETPRNETDLAIVARAYSAPDMANGPRAWAGDRLAQSVLNYHMAA